MELIAVAMALKIAGCGPVRYFKIVRKVECGLDIIKHLQIRLLITKPFHVNTPIRKKKK